MKRIYKGFLSLCLAVAVCFGVTSFYGGADYTVAEAAYTTSASTYYSSITATSGTALLGQLHDLIVDTHKTYTSYDDCKKYGPTTDPGLDGRGGVMEFYTHETIMNFVGGVGDWNREHVWCQSLSAGLWGTSGGGSDLHHIRPSESGLNSIRGNDKYGEVTGGKEAWSRDTNKNNSRLGGYYIGNTTFEPLDNVKGDVARIVMYVYTHYNNASNVNGTKESAKTHGNLPLTNVISASNATEAQNLLIKWNALDPVDEIERYRNEEVAKIQGNRNPYIDHPEYINAIWGNGTSIDPPPVGTLTGISLNATEISLNVGGTYNLTVTPVPSTASAGVTWTSSNSAVATVSNGQVTAKAAGTATITATSTSNSSIKASATVTVLGSGSSETNTGKFTITRQESFKSASGGYGLQSWSSGNVSGVAYIYGGKQDSMQFNTNNKPSQYLASTTLTGGAIKKVTINGSGNSSWTLLTSDQPYEEISSGNPTNGTSHGAASGGSWTVGGNDTYFALVLGGSGAAYLDSIEVEYGTGGGSEVPDGKLQSIALNPAAFSLKQDESTKLTVICVPSNASAEVTWTSSNEAVATVSADGTVTANKAGTATITATSTSDSTIKATAKVTVTAASINTGNEKIDAFYAAVMAIDDGGTLGEWRATINAAMIAYRALSEADRDACEGEIDILYDQIRSYNERIGGYNKAAESAEEVALKGAGRVL